MCHIERAFKMLQIHHKLCKFRVFHADLVETLNKVKKVFSVVE